MQERHCSVKVGSILHRAFETVRRVVYRHAGYITSQLSCYWPSIIECLSGTFGVIVNTRVRSSSHEYVE